MFFKKRPYKVKLKGLYKVEYSEGSKKMILDSEMMADDTIVIFKAGLEEWAPPFDGVPILVDEQSKIQTDITEDLLRSKIIVRWA